MIEEPVAVVVVDGLELLVSVRDEPEYGFLYKFAGPNGEYFELLVLFKMPLEFLQKGVADFISKVDKTQTRGSIRP
jgi:hypothetical protein